MTMQLSIVPRLVEPHTFAFSDGSFQLELKQHHILNQVHASQFCSVVAYMPLVSVPGQERISGWITSLARLAVVYNYSIRYLPSPRPAPPGPPPPPPRNMVPARTISSFGSKWFVMTVHDRAWSVLFERLIAFSGQVVQRIDEGSIFCKGDRFSLRPDQTFHLNLPADRHLPASVRRTGTICCSN